MSLYQFGYSFYVGERGRKMIKLIKKTIILFLAVMAALAMFNGLLLCDVVTTSYTTDAQGRFYSGVITAEIPILHDRYLVETQDSAVFYRYRTSPKIGLITLVSLNARQGNDIKDCL